MTNLVRSSSFNTFGWYDDNRESTYTSQEQERIEDLVASAFQKKSELFRNHCLNLLRPEHVKYLETSLFHGLSDHLSSLDCSRPWMVYWITHSLALLGQQKFLRDNDHKIVDFLKRCRSHDGGYGGGPQQEGHLATTYAAINALITIGGNIAYESIDRVALRRFLLSRQQQDGSFTLHASGEVDIRGAYCALSVAKLLHIPIYSDVYSELSDDGLFGKTADWILSCQTYEGGFGAAPGQEAHGGYTFCGVSALVLLNQLHRCDIPMLMCWTSNKQLRFEGGFCGRTNKLVDVCYSFWNGAVIPIVQAWLAKSENKQYSRWLFNQEALQKYVLLCQHINGGLMDKPGKQCDFYHTCYALSGLSMAQHSFNTHLVIGDTSNLLEPIHPLFNVTLDSVTETNEYFVENNSDFATEKSAE